jgi:hypothetical protein
MGTEAENQDYEHVLRQFINRAGLEIDHFQTLDAGRDGRTLMVITTTREVLKIVMKRWEEYYRIWTGGRVIVLTNSYSVNFML